MRVLNEAERRGLSNKLFEYLHSGLPVVTTEGTAQGDLVREHGAGEAVAGLDPADLAAATARLGVVPEAERAARSERLRSLARERFSWEAEGRALAALYARIAPG